MTVTLLEVICAAEGRHAALVGEMSGYLVLGVADQIVAACRLVAPEHVELGEEGALRVAGGRAASPAEAEVSLRGLLDVLLSASSSASAGLSRAVRRPVSGTVDALIRELEAALIPVNRAASRRALARLHRETLRARDAGQLDAGRRRSTRAPSSPPAERSSVLPVLEPEPSIDLALAAVADSAVAPVVAAPIVRRVTLPASAATHAATPTLGTHVDARTFAPPVDVEDANAVSPWALAGAPRSVAQAPDPCDEDVLDDALDALDAAELRGDDDSEPPLQLVDGDATDRMPDVEILSALSVLCSGAASGSEAMASCEAPQYGPQTTLAPSRFAPRKSDVTQLLAGFSVSETLSDRELRQDLKLFTGLELSPCAPRAITR